MAIERIKLEKKLNKEITTFFHKRKGRDMRFQTKKNITYHDFLSDKILMIAAIRAGIPNSLFHLIQHSAPFTENDWADFLNISTKSLQRYRQTSRHYFKPLHSEKIIELAEVTKVGLEVFGDMDKLKLWLNTPNFALGKTKPIELLRDSYGKELVIGELIRINHGILV